MPFFLVSWYEAFCKWPAGLRRGIIQITHAIGCMLFSILAERFYLGHTWEEAIGVAAMMILSGQYGLRLTLPEREVNGNGRDPVGKFSHNHSKYRDLERDTGGNVPDTEDDKGTS